MRVIYGAEQVEFKGDHSTTCPRSPLMASSDLPSTSSSSTDLPSTSSTGCRAITAYFRTRSSPMIPPRAQTRTANHRIWRKSVLGRRDGAVAIVCLDLISGGQECFHGYTTWKAKVCTVSGVKPTLLLDADVLR